MSYNLLKHKIIYFLLLFLISCTEDKRIVYYSKNKLTHVSLSYIDGFACLIHSDDSVHKESYIKGVINMDHVIDCKLVWKKDTCFVFYDHGEMVKIGNSKKIYLTKITQLQFDSIFSTKEITYSRCYAPLYE